MADCAKKNGLFIYLFCLEQKKSTSLKKVRFKMWSEGDNESFNVEFIWNDILVNWRSISIEDYKIMLSGSPYEDVLLCNKPKLYICSKNILGGLPCMYKTHTNSYKKKLLTQAVCSTWMSFVRNNKSSNTEMGVTGYF